MCYIHLLGRIVVIHRETDCGQSVAGPGLALVTQDPQRSKPSDDSTVTWPGFTDKVPTHYVSLMLSSELGFEHKRAHTRTPLSLWQRENCSLESYGG